jgi:hypothetical protein
MRRLVVLNRGEISTLSAGAVAGTAVAEHRTPVLLLLAREPAMLHISPVRKVTFSCEMANPLHKLGSRGSQPEQNEEENRAREHAGRVKELTPSSQLSVLARCLLHPF